MRNSIKIMIFAVVISAFGVNTFAKKTINKDFPKIPPATLAPKPFDIPKPLKPFCRMV